ncbi:MAG: hypothetical protein NVS3B20_18580 [Polyangiales bacterium]
MRAVRGGLARVSVDEVDPRTANGAKIFGFIWVDGIFDGLVVNAEFTRHYLSSKESVEAPAREPVQVSGGAGALHLEVHAARGSLDPNTVITYAPRALTLTKGDFSATADAQVDLRVVVEAGRPTARLSVGVMGFDLRRRFAEVWPLRAPNIGVVARSSTLNLLQDPLSDVIVSVDLPSATFADLRAANVFLEPKGDFTVSAGSANLKAHVDLSLADHHAQGEATFTTDHAAVRYKDASVRGKVTVVGRLSHGDYAAMRGDLSGSFVDLLDVALVKDGESPPLWWGRADFTKAFLHSTGAPNAQDARSAPAFTADVHAKCRDARPVLVLLAKDSMPAWARDLLSLDGLTAQSNLGVGRDLLELTNFIAHGGPFTILGTLRKRGAHTKGAWHIADGVLSAGVELRDGETKVTPMATEGWYRALEK